MMTADILLSRLAEASRGLLYRSETDVEYTAFVWPEMTGTPTDEAIRLREGHASSDPAEVQTVCFFFRHVEAEERQRYDTLVALLDATLVDATVIRIGRIRKSCYIIGTVRDGCGWAGLKTEAVET